jgi:hypothetical protein
MEFSALTANYVPMVVNVRRPTVARFSVALKTLLQKLNYFFARDQHSHEKSYRVGNHILTVGPQTFSPPTAVRQYADHILDYFPNDSQTKEQHKFGWK